MDEETIKTLWINDQWIKNHVEYEAMMVCATCFEIYGPWHYKKDVGALDFFQVCAFNCPQDRWYEARWPTRFDFNRVAELCYCCGQEVLKSGNKFSVWFCDECKERVTQFNTQYQRTIIPIGRHSIMAGYSLRAKDAHDPEMIKTFTKNLGNLSSGIDCLIEWKKFIHAENFKTLGCVNDTPLKDYLVQTKKLGEKSTFFLLLKDFFEQKLSGGQSS